MDSLASPVVLVVDDEVMIRMYAVDVLQEAGFTVLEAASGAEALIQIEAHPEISVLFTDIQMPGEFDGLALARTVHDRRPDIQVIVASGNTRPTPEQLPDSGRFVPKPYDGFAVARMIGGQRA